MDTCKAHGERRERDGRVAEEDGHLDVVSGCVARRRPLQVVLLIYVYTYFPPRNIDSVSSTAGSWREVTCRFARVSDFLRWQPSSPFPLTAHASRPSESTTAEGTHRALALHPTMQPRMGLRTTARLDEPPITKCPRTSGLYSGGPFRGRMDGSQGKALMASTPRTWIVAPDENAGSY